MNVSVVIPTYNASRFIVRALDSVARQSRPAAEIVVVDDASPDDTVGVVKAWADSSVVPVKTIALQKNCGGPARPLNVGIGLATGDLIATLDHDDQFAVTKLQDQVGLLTQSPDLGLAFGDLEFYGDDGERNRLEREGRRSSIERLDKSPVPHGYRVSSAEAVKEIVRGHTFVATCSNMLFPKRVWQSVGGFDEKTTVASDLAFLAAVCSRYDVGYVPSTSAVWTLRPDSFYRVVSDTRRLEDQFRTLTRLYRSRLPAALRVDLKHSIRKLAFDAAFELRQAGSYWHAANYLTRAIRSTGPSSRGLLALGRLVPHAGWRFARRHVSSPN